MDRPQRMRDLLETMRQAADLDQEEEEEEEILDLDEILTSCLDELDNKNDADLIRVYCEENPYETVEINEETRMFQVVGNEIIYMTRAEGYCCVCHEKTTILYVDNSYGANIPAQLCSGCIGKIIS
jgi:hypothetical protein